MAAYLLFPIPWEEKFPFALAEFTFERLSSIPEKTKEDI